VQSNLIAKVVAAGAKFDDRKVSPVVRQTLQHWGYRLTEEHFRAYAERLAGGARAPYIPGGVVTAPSRPSSAPAGGAGASSAGVGKKRGRAEGESDAASSDKRKRS